MNAWLTNFRERYKRYEAPAFFTAGFLFDVFTLRRIDDWLKIGFQIAFLILLGGLLIAERRLQLGQAVPARLQKIWTYHTDIVHFLFGSLLSAFVIFYFKSASFTRSAVFLFLLIALMVLNEMPQVRALGLKLRVALYGFCIASFFIYFLPILTGKINSWIFVASIFVALFLTFIFVRLFEKNDYLRVGAIAFSIQILLLFLYFVKVIPPVPLSLTYAGIYYKVEREDDKMKLYSLKPWYDFWSRGQKVFKARAGDKVYCYFRVFAPAQFKHNVYLRWLLLDERTGRFLTQDHISVPIAGGREAGFRGFEYKSHYQPGRWRVDVETEDERVIGSVSFWLVADGDTTDRIFMREED